MTNRSNRPHSYTVDGVHPHGRRLSWYLSTDSEDDPGITVDDMDDGSRIYRYSADGAAVAIGSRYRRAAAAAIAAYDRRTI